MILDTNAYSALMRGWPSIVAAIADADELCLPLPVVAELRYGFSRGSQRERNESVLDDFLAQPQAVVLCPTLATTKIYATLHAHSTSQGKALSQNDIWIAALASEHSDAFATYDTDFEVFREHFKDKLLLLTAE